MKRKKIHWYTITCIIQLAWIVMCLVDRVIFQAVGFPVFCIPSAGGEIITYSGLGYTLNVVYPLTQEAAGDVSTFVTATPFWIGQAVLLVVNLAAVLVARSKRKSGAMQTGA